MNTKRVEQMTDSEVLANRVWPAHLTVEQMRAKLAHEQNGSPAPWAGAKWNPLGYWQ